MITPEALTAAIDDTVFRRQEAIICSMTPRERRDARILNASRKRRIAAGSGTTVQDVNKLLKMHKEMATVMKRMAKMGKKRGGMMPPAGALPPGFEDLIPRR